MPLRKPNLFLKSFSTSTPQSTSLNWRTQLKQSQLISQISSTLLQRRNWAPLLSTLNLSSSILTPPLFLHILHRTQSNPQLSLTFFNWARTNLGFKPDLKTLSKLTQILICSGLALQSKPILDSLIQTYPPTQIVDSAIHACRVTKVASSPSSQSPASLLRPSISGTSRSRTASIVTSPIFKQPRDQSEALAMNKLVAGFTKDVEELAYHYAMEGKVIELAVLLIVAQEKVLVPITFHGKDGAGLNGSMTIHECLRNQCLSLTRRSTLWIKLNIRN